MVLTKPIGGPLPDHFIGCGQFRFRNDAGAQFPLRKLLADGCGFFGARHRPWEPRGMASMKDSLLNRSAAFVLPVEVRVGASLSTSSIGQAASWEAWRRENAGESAKWRSSTASESRETLSRSWDCPCLGWSVARACSTGIDECGA